MHRGVLLPAEANVSVFGYTILGSIGDDVNLVVMVVVKSQCATLVPKLDTLAVEGD